MAAAAELRGPEPAAAPVAVPPLVMENGLGGFAPDGREYVIVLDGERETPLPWSNVIANPGVGTIVSSSGSAFTWAGNSRENRLTPFANDPLTDPTAEAVYLRDDDSGAVWGATPAPLGNGTAEYPHGDNIQTVEPWQPPDTWAGLDSALLNRILDALDAGMADGQRYSSAGSAVKRAAWRVVEQHAPGKPEKACRFIINAWKSP